MTERKSLLSFQKGVLITLVVFAHCLQYGIRPISNDIFSNKLFQVIYSFHMPLFALISGYLFGGQLCKYQPLELMKRKVSSMIPPIIIWGGFSSLIHVLLRQISKQNISMIDFFEVYIQQVYTSWWFIWGILYCSLIVGVLYYFKAPRWSYLLFEILLLFIPDIYNLELYGFIYFYFAIGCVYKLSNFEALKNVVFNGRRSLIVLLSTTLVYGFMLYFYTESTFIYVGGESFIGCTDVITQLKINSYRFLIGLIGCIVIFLWLRMVYLHQSENRIVQTFCYIGNRSMTIYLISIIINEIILIRIGQRLNGNVVLAMVETILVILVSVTVNDILSHNKSLKKYLLGNR